MILPFDAFSLFSLDPSDTRNTEFPSGQTGLYEPSSYVQIVFPVAAENAEVAPA